MAELKNSTRVSVQGQIFGTIEHSTDDIDFGEWDGNEPGTLYQVRLDKPVIPQSGVSWSVGLFCRKDLMVLEVERKTNETRAGLRITLSEHLADALISLFEASIEKGYNYDDRMLADRNAFRRSVERARVRKRFRERQKARTKIQGF